MDSSERLARVQRLLAGLPGPCGNEHLWASIDFVDGEEPLTEVFAFLVDCGAIDSASSFGGPPQVPQNTDGLAACLAEVDQDTALAVLVGMTSRTLAYGAQTGPRRRRELVAAPVPADRCTHPQPAGSTCGVGGSATVADATGGLARCVRRGRHRGPGGGVRRIDGAGAGWVTGLPTADDVVTECLAALSADPDTSRLLGHDRDLQGLTIEELRASRQAKNLINAAAWYLEAVEDAALAERLRGWLAIKYQLV